MVFINNIMQQDIVFNNSKISRLAYVFKNTCREVG